MPPSLDAQRKKELVIRLQDYCPSQLVSLQKCIDGIQQKEEAESWAGRVCCHLAETETCREACSTATHLNNLRPSCRYSDEVILYECVEKKQKGEDCCEMARNSDCHALCRQSLINGRVTRSEFEASCAGNVNNCMTSITNRPTYFMAQTLSHCCEKTSSKACREKCKLLVQSNSNDQHLIQELYLNNCWPNSRDPDIVDMLKCFMSNNEVRLPSPFDLNGGVIREEPISLESISLSSSRRLSGRHNSYPGSSIADIGMDINKMYCCSKASSLRCKNLCHQSFSNRWSDDYVQFDRDCLQDPREVNLNFCLDDVEESCELGCDGLSFCSSFNRKETELFRSCNEEAESAIRDFEYLKHNSRIEIPQLAPYTLYLKNITNCAPIMWKTVICALKVKPCTVKSHNNSICRNDCFNLLSSCLIPERMNGMTAADVCNRLSPSSDDCIRLEDYLKEPSKKKKTSSMALAKLSPCRKNTCNVMQSCVVNRLCINCPQYTCEPGCKMGEISNYVVPTGTYVSILSENRAHCFKLCQCSPQGTFKQCLNPFCKNPDGCMWNESIIENHQSIETNCTKCVCHWGDLICNKSRCDNGGSTGDLATNGLPCQCRTHYLPVCVWNGLTLPNECLAKCFGYTPQQYKPGACSPCSGVTCAYNEVCIPSPKVCLYTLEKFCPQSECVKVEEYCSGSYHPVCSQDGETFNNTCLLFRANKKFGYLGPCLGRCSSSGVICGVDGNTYSSECAANARFVKLDYEGSCRALGIADSKPRCPASVKCPPLVHEACYGYIPPGACCFTCGGAMRIVFSQKDIDKAFTILRSDGGIQVFTVESIMKSLERHIKILGCRIFGHLTLEGDLFVMVNPISHKFTKIEMTLCLRELDKLSVLIEKRNPKLLSVLNTSPLIMATKVYSHSLAVPLSIPSMVLVHAAIFFAIFIR